MIIYFDLYEFYLSFLIYFRFFCAENIWHTELDFMMTHRDRLVVLSFMNSPYQNISNDDQNDIKDLLQTQLIEKYHSDVFDDNDYFDTHEKMKAETTAATSLITSISGQKTIYPMNALPTGATNIDGMKQFENVNKKNRSKNRNNNGNGSRKNHRNGDDISMRRKNVEDVSIKANKNVELNQSKGGDGTFDENSNGKLSKKFTNQQEINGGGERNDSPSISNKRTTTKNSNIHVVKSVDGFIPSTPHSTDSKIIEIKPSTGRIPKKNKRSVTEVLETYADSDSIQTSIAGDVDDDDVPVPRLFIETFDSSETIPLIADRIEAAPLVGPTPMNVTPTTITETIMPTLHLNAFAAYLHKYMKVNKEIGMQNHHVLTVSIQNQNHVFLFNAFYPFFLYQYFSVLFCSFYFTFFYIFFSSASRFSVDVKKWTNSTSFEFLNFIVALIVWSSRYPSVFWATSKPFSIIFSIQMIANSIDILLGYAGISVMYKLSVVGRQLPLQVG